MNPLAARTLNLLRKKCSYTLPAKCFGTTAINRLFYEKDYKSGYPDGSDKYGMFEKIKMGFKQLKGEIKLFKEEIKEHFRSDPVMVYQPGVIDKKWQFLDPSHLDTWKTTSDSDHAQGFSSCSLSITQHNKALFTGILSTEIPKDGVIKRAGYCNMNSYHNWTPYTHLVLRVRGDGRSYTLNIANSGYFDQFWHDIYHFVLYTRGGPYWQIAKIPFSKFIFSSKGRVQDFQDSVLLDRVSHFGITAADKINGPFALEIDYIGLEYIPQHTEKFAYEMYRLPKNIVGE